MLHFIVNPKARSGKGRQLWEQLLPILNESGAEYDVHMTTYGGETVKFAEKLTSGGEETTIIVLGGDGSVNEAVNGICYPDRCTLGYIPTGSGNDFARSLGISRDPETALKDILSREHTVQVNLGICEYDNTKRRFAVSSGIGFDAGVCHGVEVSRAKTFLNRIKLGKLVYLVIALKQILFQPRVDMKVMLDDETLMYFPHALFGVGMNMPYEGGGYNFCPDASYDDDALDFFVVNDITFLQFLRMMPFALSGKHLRFKKQTHCYRGRKAVITIDKPLPLHADGEPIPANTCITLSLMAEKLNVITH